MTASGQRPRRRLLLVDAGLRLFGSERAVLATVPSLVNAHDVFALVPDGAELGPELRALGVEVLEGPIGHLHRHGLAARMRATVLLLAVCIRHRIDLLYLNQAGFCRIGHAVARLLGLRTVMHIRLLDDIARCAALTPTARAPLDVITISEDVTKRFARIAGQKPYLRTTFAYDVFETAALPTDISCERSSFACLGRIEPSKGQLELVQAARLVARTHPDIRVDIIGDDYGHESYGRSVVDLSDDCGVRLLGYQKDAATLLPAYGFVVAPTRYETLGRTIFEAWNAGCVPICSADSGGAAEIVARSKGGLLYKGFEPAALAQAMAEALALSAHQRDDFVERGRIWMKENTALAVYRARLKGVLYPAV